MYTLVKPAKDTLSMSKTLRQITTNAVRSFHTRSKKTVRKGRIYIATWMEGQNFGDDYLGIAVRQYLKREYPQLDEPYQVNLRADGCQLTSDDILIIAGGGIWGPSGTGHLETSLCDVWLRTEAQLVVANIGIESFVPQASEQLAAVGGKAVLFSVRDRDSWLVTSSILGEKVFWSADSTYLSPIQIQREPVEGSIAFNLCGPEQENYYRSYSIDSIVESMLGLSTSGHKLKGTVFTYRNALSDFKYCKLIDPSCIDDFSIEPYRECEVFIGMHFHSVLLALQNCIPVIAIAYSSKVRRVMQEYGLEGLCIDPNDPEITEKIHYLVETLDRVQTIGLIQQGNRNAENRIAHFKKELSELIVKQLQWV